MKRADLSEKSPEALFGLFDRNAILPDMDGDGLPDAVKLDIIVRPGLFDPHIWAGILNLAARLASETMALDLPLVRTGAPDPSRASLVVFPPDGRDAPAGIVREESGGYALRGGSGEEMGRVLNRLALGNFRSGHQDGRAPAPAGRNESAGFDLLSLTGDRGLYRIPPDAPRERILRAGIRLDEGRISPVLGVALAESVCRMCLEATEVLLPIADVGTDPGHEIVLRIQPDKDVPRISLSHPDNDCKRIDIRGASVPLANALRSWLQPAMSDGGPEGEAMDAFRERIWEFRDILCGKGYWGKWAHGLASGEALPESLPPVPARRMGKMEKAFRVLSMAGPSREKPSRPLVRRTSWQGETERILDRVRSLPPGTGKVTGEVFASKPLKSREALKSSMERILAERGYPSGIVVLNAYKPGLSWLLESILPRLRSIPGIADLEIAYCPFRGQGALEMRSRWLQEIYPGPELMARELRLDVGRIRLVEAGDLTETYRIRVRDAQGSLALEGFLSPPFSRISYRKDLPDKGHVHPAAAGIRLRLDGRVFLDESLETDRDIFWKTFRSRWLAALEERMENRLVREDPSGRNAFWEEVRVEVFIEETEAPLDFQEERISPMEALHEDLYFYLLDAFSDFSRSHGLPPSLQMGRIVPLTWSHLRGDRPEAAIIARPLSWPGTPGAPRSHGLPEPRLVSMGMEKRRWNLDFETDGLPDAPFTDRLLKVAGAWGFRAQRVDGRIRLETRGPDKRPGAARSQAIFSSPASAWEESGPPEDRRLSALEVSQWLSRLGAFPELRVWKCGKSWQGRPIHTIEAFIQEGGSLVSHARRRLMKPVLFFNARHHANEISSTNAALGMARRMACSHWGRRMLRQMTVVWIPVENPDGVATLEEILSQGEDRKLHAARYNALGAEFYGDYFDSPPRFPEAAAKTRMWRRWLPEIMVDHHGVPSHEWEQPFSGYAPFRFREFWIPRTFVYVIVPFIDEIDHPLHGKALELCRILGEAMGKDPEISSENRRLAGIYRRYAAGVEPEAFPPSSGEPLLALPLSGRIRETNFAVRHPGVTLSEIIVEVPDEVASGKQLALCVRAHRKIQEGLILFLKPRSGSVKTFPDPYSGGIRIRWGVDAEPLPSNS